MAVQALALAAVGAQASGQILGAFYRSKQKKNEAAIAKYNAAVMRNQAEAIRIRTKFQQERQAEEAARIEGELRVAIGGAGIVSTQGAPLLALALQRTEANLENYLIGYEGRILAQEAESKALEFDMQGRMFRIGARQELIGGFLGAGATTLSGWSNLPERTGGGGTTIGYAKGYSATATPGAGRL